MTTHSIRSLLCAAALLAGAAAAQTPANTAAPASASAPAATGAIQSQNIFQIAPDAAADPGYAAQNNGARAQVQPGNNAPLWRQVGQGASGHSSLPLAQAPEAGNLIQPFVNYPGARVANAGEAWRQVRNRWILPWGAALLALALLTLAAFHLVKGPLGSAQSACDPAPGARRIERFTPFERAAHWANAIAFCTLALSGIVMAWGKFFLLPVLGATLFGWLSFALKNLHNFMGPLFAVSLLVIVLTFARDNIMRRSDLAWLAKGGGMLGGDGKEIPSHRFNAGEKGLFWWGITLPGIVVVGSGLVLDRLIPGLGDLRADMQIAHMLHATLAIWMIALLCGHIYMGTAGMRGAYKAMKTGHVSEAWAKEHHALWYEDVVAGKIARQRSGTTPSSAGGAAATGQPVQT